VAGALQPGEPGRPGELTDPPTRQTPQHPPATTTNPEVQAVAGLGDDVWWKYVQYLAAAAAALGTAVVSLRLAGPAVYGSYAVLIGIGSLLGLADAGLSLVVVTDTARQAGNIDEAEREAKRREVVDAYGAYLALSLLVVLVVIVLAVAFLVTGRGSDAVLRSAALVAVGIGVALTLASAAAAGVASGLRRFRLLAIGAAVGGLAQLAITAVSVKAIGVLGLGLGQLAFAGVSRATIVLAVSRVQWFPRIPPRPSLTRLRGLTGHAAPILLLGIGAQVISTSDILILGWLFVPAVVGLYKLGSTFPSQGANALLLGFDAAYPSVVAAHRDEQERVLRIIYRLLCFLGGIGLGALCGLRDTITNLMLGHPDAFAGRVIIVFSLIWMTIMATHSLVMVTLARGLQSRLVSLTLVEIVANLALTFALIPLIGPIGAATATLITLFVGNAIILPRVSGHHFKSGASRLVFVYAYLPGAIGLATAWGISAGVEAVVTDQYARVIVALAGCALGVVAFAVVIGPRRRDDIVRLLRRQPALAAVSAPGEVPV
jgi:O-antigen/teichoic acid export membrane protein